MDMMTVAEMTVDELRSLIENIVEEKLSELIRDPDHGLELREEFKARLRQTIEAEKRGVPGIPAEEVAKQFGVPW
jgi:hypothetical protein